MISFDEANHLYALNGVPVPGVTSILTGLNLIDTKWFTPASRFRGKAVHAAIQFWLEDDLDWNSLSPGLVGYVRSAIRFIETIGLEVARVETLLGSAVHGFCGTGDVIGKVRGEPTVPDWKSGEVLPVTGYQLSGYEICLREENPALDRWRRIGVPLQKDGSLPKAVNFTESRDERRFLNALDLYRAHVWPREKKYGIGSDRAA